MKTRNLLIFLLGSLLFPACLTSCGEDRWAAYAEQTETCRWIDDSLRVWYYWRDEIPSNDELNYFSAPFTFFKSMLSSQDKFSYIDSLNTTASSRSIPYTDYSYGMEFGAAKVSGETTSQYLAPVYYVAEGTPAAECGLKRGDWICSINGEAVNKDNITMLYGGNAIEIGVAHYDAESGSIVPESTPRTLGAARAIEDDPVHYASVIESAGGHRVGYLVYNHFTPGAADGNEYDNRLRTAFAAFASQGVEELVLDLRYNNGGLITCAQLLATMLVPQAQIDQPMAYTEYNPNVSSKYLVYNFDSQLIGGGANLGLKRLFVLTGSNTASASELVVNCLRPYMEVVLIGTTTVGKNVGSINFTSERLMITMNPIVCKIYNAEMDSDYEDGFTPTYEVSELGNVAAFLPFGNPQEALLSQALSVIDGATEAPETRSSAAARLQVSVTESSIERRASGAVVIR